MIDIFVRFDSNINTTKSSERYKERVEGGDSDYFRKVVVALYVILVNYEHCIVDHDNLKHYSILRRQIMLS